MPKYRILLVAECESECDAKTLFDNVTLTLRAGEELKNITLEQLEVEELDYPDIDILKI